MKYTILFITVILALFCRAFLVSVYKVPSQKMAPAIFSGEYLLASKISFGLKFPWSDEIIFQRAPSRGELVVFNRDSRTFIKRVIAGNLDEIEYLGGEFSVNSSKCNYVLVEKTDDPAHGLYREECGDSARTIYRPYDVAKLLPVNKVKLDNTHILVADDFRGAGAEPDSAEVIAVDQIIGKPLFVWMSYSSTQDFISKSLGIRMNRILTKLQ